MHVPAASRAAGVRILPGRLEKATPGAMKRRACHVTLMSFERAAAAGNDADVT
jgi:hypothetical protein